MDTDAMVMALIAIADIALIVHLRRLHGRGTRMERMMDALRRAIRHANNVEERPRARRLLRANLPL